ncbi:MULTISPECIES: DeoR/GlpR family DNA-binding transcription regulator [Shuttleworthella]|uniref:Transcriptional regulator, DeoR family n=1 Tax=Shuttleworthella satelles DSM 14600 TaxID=626523 RepID=C4G9I6_9FIRM|nr:MULTISPECIES: DeoR/GlpR family DNA-binding transcription regulator [Shuttleworthia]EEP29283.1 transcriptional regulator, DeoR family [Shuttleworthia satelles DSM 14600]EUB12800.1 transcriptional regulator, DeoR family [Shuttleworthia sp. MSX8B]
MLAMERRNLILEKLQEEKKVVVNALARQFDVSEETIRRDLDKLEQDGVCTKSYGGAVFNENTTIDMPFNVRTKNHVQGKQKIAALVAGMIEEGDHIILDASSTAVFIAKEIKEKEHLTVITNSIEIMIELSNVSGWDVISSGGRLKPGDLALIGPRALGGLSAFNVEKAFFSCKGVDAERGLTDSDDQLTQTKQVLMKSAQKKVVTVDSSKFERVAFAKICDIRDVDVIVTDQKPSESWLSFLKRNHVECLYPQEK